MTTQKSIIKLMKTANLCFNQLNHTYLLLLQNAYLHASQIMTNANFCDDIIHRNPTIKYTIVTIAKHTIYTYQKLYIISNTIFCILLYFKQCNNSKQQTYKCKILDPKLNKIKFRQASSLYKSLVALFYFSQQRKEYYINMTTQKSIIKLMKTANLCFNQLNHTYLLLLQNAYLHASQIMTNANFCDDIIHKNDMQYLIYIHTYICVVAFQDIRQYYEEFQ
eukprot:TRINITY_DN7064_c0_g1_i8.p2 TRINITY_DN7064_c0_g1~~TRINITY_DN7064_c0_g1_i8.p2  ORF type:complete len:221 (+),score=-14.35 TRINITY_DN7064_c0_g1_i8:559-1221(+)